MGIVFNEKHRLQMQSFVAKKFENGQTRIERNEIETVGANMGLSPEESARLFESLEGDHWRGDYLALDEQERWSAVSVADVS
ncbi:hypothetical protein BH24ACT19_BH24ACT19_10000 [soil metagenome]